MRAGTLFIDAFVDFVLICLIFFGGSTCSGRYPVSSGVKFHVECSQNHVGGPLGARVMSKFVEIYLYIYICVKVELGDNHG